ncbi:MAG: hypothetical protein ACXW4T_00545 [Candidatus Limnocylindrales bacterium]
MRRIPRFLSLFSVVAIGLVATGCGGTAATPSPTAAQSAAAGAVAVTLSEWKVVPASATAAAGPITFAVTNAGSQVHEFVVVKTDLKADALPVADNKIDESTLTPVEEIEDIAAGATPSLSVDLAAGHYVLLCNIETHYGQGMHADFDVN